MAAVRGTGEFRLDAAIDGVSALPGQGGGGAGRLGSPRNDDKTCRRRPPV